MTSPVVPGGLELTALSDLLAEPDEAVDYLVEERIAYGSVNLLAGKPKAGKSTAARGLALEVARGGSWLGFSCLPRPVWYLALEDKRSEVRRHFPDAPIHLHPADVPMVEAMPQQARMFGLQLEAPPAIDHHLTPGQQVEVGRTIRFHVLFTPGHTPGGVTFYEPHEGVALVGDTLFQGSIGRTDLPGGDARRLLASLREELLALPDETRCYSGHGPSTTIGAERSSNPFLQPGAERLFGLQ